MVHKKGKIFMLAIVLFMIFIMQYASVDAQSEDNSLVYEGDDYFVELNFGADADIREDAYLKVTEINEGSKEYSQYLSKTEEFVSEEEDAKVLFARFFDVCIMAGEKEIEPDDSVNVSITYEKGIEKTKEEKISVVHFVENGSEELLDVREECQKDAVTKITFEQDSFSVIGMILFDGVDTNVKSPESEIITGTDIIYVNKEWSDGEEVHKEDEVTVTLYEQGKKKDEIILNSENRWSGAFENLDEKKEYSIKETKAKSGNQDLSATYKTTITNVCEKRWCLEEENQFEDRKKVILAFEDGDYKILRKSANYDEMNLKATKVDIANDDLHDNYLQTEVKNNYIWTVCWNENSKAWNLYCGNAYLTLSYDEESGLYEWISSKELTEGSDLSYENGIISATVGNVTKCLGNITEEGPYEGLDIDSPGIVKFQIYKYRNFPPVICDIYNEKNATTEEHETSVDVITNKTIDYLGDGKDNPETDADNGKLEQNILNNLYRLNLSVRMQTDVTGLDLLMVIDVSSSMKSCEDAKDENGNLIPRSEALRQALNAFVPQFLNEETKNRLAVVAFESESMILQEWTNDPKELLEKINYESEGELPLYNGEGTNYEVALARAHEALTMRGYSNNAKAMLFLSDGEPTIYLEGNDDNEAGNVTCNLGEAELSDMGIQGTLPDNMRVVWGMTDGKAKESADEAIVSFQKHNPEIMVGTVAFNTKVTDSLKNLATDENFVVKIENGTPSDLIDAMDLITEYTPSNIVIIDELSENVELYKEYPDYKITERKSSGEETLLYSANEGLTSKGKEILNNKNPLVVSGKKIIMSFRKDYIVKNKDTYELSFNINTSQRAFEKYADSKGKYTDKGDYDTDYVGNETSSLKEGFYSNGDATKVSYMLNGVEISRKYRQPVVQAEKGSLNVKKTDISGNIISTGAEFSLYREASETDEQTVTLDGLSGEFVQVANGITNQNGLISFENLRLAVFDTGYPYYLVEEKAPDGYAKRKVPIKVTVFEDHVEITEKDKSVLVNEDGEVVVCNRKRADVSFTKVAAGDKKEKLSGARFELSVLNCTESSHKHDDDCWEYVETQESNPEVKFRELICGMTYRLTEIAAPDGYICPEGSWLIRMDDELMIESDDGQPLFYQTGDGSYLLENEQMIKIPVTGGAGVFFSSLIGIMLITGGLFMRNKKNLSKMLSILAVVLAAVQMISLTAFAIDKKETGTIQVNHVEDYANIHAYRLMDINFDYQTNQPKNPMYMWTEEVAGWMQENYPEYIDVNNKNAVRESFSDAKDAEVAGVYDRLAVAVKTGKVSPECKTVEADNETVIIDGLTMGNYFLLIEDGLKVYRPLTANVVPKWTENSWEMTNPVVEAKGMMPNIIKTVNSDLHEDHVQIGDTVSYKLEASIPEYPENSYRKDFVISDKLSDGLTFDEASLKVYGVNTGEEDVLLETGFTRLEKRPVDGVAEEMTFTLTFDYDAICAFESLKVTYNAVLNEKAVVGETGNSNIALLDYNNNPYVEESFVTDADETTVYTYGLKIYKVDEDTDEGLEGAEFTLSKDGTEIKFVEKDGKYYAQGADTDCAVSVKSSSDGTIILNGLDVGTYTLTEVKAPDGYVKLQNPMEITISDKNLNGKADVDGQELSDGYVPVTVKNDKGFTLPVTGGMGTTLFSAAGVMLIGCGLLMMIFRSGGGKRRK